MVQSIEFLLRHHVRVQGGELTVDDVGRNMGRGWGYVLSADIGKRVWLKDYGLIMENAAQRDRRKR